MNELGANEDLREARQRYFERYAFPLFSHIDFRVSDAQTVKPFYDALMALFGTEPTTVIDFSQAEPEIVRRGAGDTAAFE